jgi:NTE family protein
LRLADFDLALVLSGGAALGAYHAGVYEALAEAGLRSSHIAGTSIGAISGALIAGNPPEQRLERLRRFWAMVAEPVAGGPAGVGGPWVRTQGYLAALRARLAGWPGLFLPQLLEALAPWPLRRRPGLYDRTPVLGSLAELVAAPGLCLDDVRLTIHATDVATGQPVRFDSRIRPLETVQVRASTSLIPDLEPVEIDGRLLCDGGFSENLPLRAVLGAVPERPLLCIAADLIAAEREPRWSLDGMADRQQDLHFASQTQALIQAVTAELALAYATARRALPPVILAHIVPGTRGSRVPEGL